MAETSFNERLLWAIEKSEYKNITRVARKLDVDRKTVDKWVKGLSSPTISHVTSLCNILSISPEWLILNKGVPKEKEKQENVIAKNDFSIRLMQSIKNSGYKSVSRVARQLDVDRKSISRWINATSDPSVYYIIKICKLLNISCSWLLYGEEITCEK